MQNCLVTKSCLWQKKIKTCCHFLVLNLNFNNNHSVIFGPLNIEILSNNWAFLYASMYNVCLHIDQNKECIPCVHIHTQHQTCLPVSRFTYHFLAVFRIHYSPATFFLHRSYFCLYNPIPQRNNTPRWPM